MFLFQTAADLDVVGHLVSLLLLLLLVVEKCEHVEDVNVSGSWSPFGLIDGRGQAGGQAGGGDEGCCCSSEGGGGLAGEEKRKSFRIK